MSQLPITRCLTEIVDAIAHGPVVLKAPPGAGKTTGVPPALLDSGFASDGQIVVVQPRRMAARSAASRLALLDGSRVGDRIGYHVRFDRRASKSTEVLVTTTGMLLRRLQSDPLLEEVGCVLLDEFHERSLDVDLALGMLQRIRTTFRPELKLIVMSATLDPEPIANFLGRNAKSVISQGRAYPVDLQYAPPKSPRDRIEQSVAEILPQALRQSDGDVLVFLPGLGEIRRTRRTIEPIALSAGAELMELYGDLPPKQQDAVLRPSTVRKIVLATNVAETSVTIPGVTCVIDSGLARVMRFDASIGLPKLQRETISQASAEQRAGRAGRTGPGICYRLWSAAAHRSRRERDTPEIERTDLSGALLSLAAWGEKDPFDFPWLTPPPKASVESATALLRRLGAIDQAVSGPGGGGSLTETGRRMVPIPIHPRLGRFLLEASRLGIADAASVAAALLTERDPFRGNRESKLELFEKVEILQRHFAGKKSASLSEGPAEQIRKVASQMKRVIQENTTDQNDSTGDSNDDVLAHALLTAYPDRVARLRDGSSDRGVMVGGRGVRFETSSDDGSSNLFVCLDVDSGDSEARVRSAHRIKEDWLDETLIKIVDAYDFDPESGSVVARRRTYFQDLLLREHPIPCDPGPDVAGTLVSAARSNRHLIFPKDNEAISEFVERTRFVARHLPDADVRPIDDDRMDELLESLCQSRTSLQQLRDAPWLDHLKGMYEYQQLKTIEQNAPPRLQAPSGNSIRVRYQPGKPPMVEVRIQEVFGWSDNPRIAGGRVPIQMHLLGPNYRPQQITEDLANFWKSTYQEVRKELRRRYPKHHWPEDPTTAMATRNGLKPRQ